MHPCMLTWYTSSFDLPSSNCKIILIFQIYNHLHQRKATATDIYNLLSHTASKKFHSSNPFRKLRLSWNQTEFTTSLPSSWHCNLYILWYFFIKILSFIQGIRNARGKSTLSICRNKKKREEFCIDRSICSKYPPDWS